MVLLDFTTWKRAEKFNYFTTKEKCVISLTCDIDVTDFVHNCKEKGLKFYTAFIGVLSYTLNAEEHFRYGRDENGNLILFDHINPFFTDFIAETNDFNCMTAEYTSDMNELYNRIARTREKNKGKEKLVPENMTDNIFSITVLPWVHYRHLDIIESNSENNLAPSIAFGKYEEENGKLMMPLTLWVHHAVCDGYQASKFFSGIEQNMKKSNILHER